MEKTAKEKYIPWAEAGGPNECEHGYAKGIPCPHCGRQSAALHESVAQFSLADYNPNDEKFAQPEAQPPCCTCIKDGSSFCKFPHPCRRCHEYHPGVSCYWHAQGKTPSDKRPGGRTFMRSDGSAGCDECCNGDRCDDTSHHDRDNCPYCLGSGTPPQSTPPKQRADYLGDVNELVAARPEAVRMPIRRYAPIEYDEMPGEMVTAADYETERAAHERTKEELEQAKRDKDFAGRILGLICVYGTLVHGERPVDPPPHAAVDAILTQINRAEKAEAELESLRAELAAVKK